MGLSCNIPWRIYPGNIIEIEHEVSDELDLNEEDVIWLGALKVGT